MARDVIFADDDYDEFSNKNEMILITKYIADGAKTLSEAAEKLESFARWLRELEEEGWQLEQAIEDDYSFLRREM